MKIKMPEKSNVFKYWLVLFSYNYLWVFFVVAAFCFLGIMGDTSVLLATQTQVTVNLKLYYSAILLLFCPLSETLLLVLIVFILKKLISSVQLICIVSAVIWGIIHSLIVFPALGVIVLVPFYIFTYVYIDWRSKGWWIAFFMCAFQHVLHNAVPTSALWVF